MAEERILPIRITDHDTGETYELDFSRDSVVFAEQRGFEPESITTFPATKIPEFFYYAFRKNHRKLAKNQTDALLDKLGGLTDKMLERLILLYQQAQMANNIIQDEEDLVKNAKMTVEM